MCLIAISLALKLIMLWYSQVGNLRPPLLGCMKRLISTQSNFPVDKKSIVCEGKNVDLLQVSLLINKQTGGKKKKTEEIRGGERDLWTTCSENEIGQDLDRRLSFMLAEEPIKLEQVNKSLIFGARSPQVSLSSPFPFRFLLLLPSHLFIDQERDLEQVQ